MKIFSSPSILLVLIFSLSCNDSPVGASKEESAVKDTSSLEGGWELVSAKYNDTIADVIKNPQFKMFHGGIFSLIARDSSGKISFAGFGKYEFDGKAYKETFLYHDNPEYVGAMDWQEYTLNGDTLYCKGFNKVIVGGKEQSGFPKIEEKRVRIK